MNTRRSQFRVPRFIFRLSVHNRWAWSFRRTVKQKCKKLLTEQLRFFCSIFSLSLSPSSLLSSYVNGFAQVLHQCFPRRSLSVVFKVMTFISCQSVSKESSTKVTNDARWICLIGERIMRTHCGNLETILKQYKYNIRTVELRLYELHSFDRNFS